jgi:glycosyltransferase involved in cell wall biosynthesis
LAQRLALVPLISTAQRLIVTTPERVVWLGARPWLRAAHVDFVPVFSNIPVAPPPTDANDQRTAVVPGYAAEGVDEVLVTKAAVTARIPLTLLGAPGPDSDGGRRWIAAADKAGCELRFTGVTSPEKLSRTLSSAAIVVNGDRSGPTSRRTMLAAALAHGRPVVAVNGKETWAEIVRAEAVELVEPTVTELAAAMIRLVDDPGRRAVLGGRAAAFYEHRMCLERAAERVSASLVAATVDWVQ